jgi:hypothetical protein
MKAQINDLASQIDKTPGFKCIDFRAVNETTGKTMVLHQTPSDRRAVKNLTTDLKNLLGWTVDLYNTAQKEDRERRMAEHNARVPALNFLQPTVATVEAAGMDLGTLNGDAHLNDLTDHEGHAVAPLTFAGIIPSFEYIGAETANKYFNARLDSHAETALGIRNRHYSTDVAMQYAKAIVRNEWLPNPHGIMFSTDESGQEWLIDGQQRMAAVLFASEMYRKEHGEHNEMPPVGFWVYRNVPAEMFKVVDTGRRRSISQILQMLGCPNYTVAGASLRYIWLWFNVPDQSKWKRYPSFTGTQIEQVYMAHKDVDKDTYKIANAAKLPGLSRSAMVAAIYLIRYHVPEADVRPPVAPGEQIKLSVLEQFVEDFHSGASMEQGDPVLSLRNWAINRNNRKTAPRKDPTEEMDITQVMFDMMLIIRAWNSRVRGDKIANPSWRAGQIIPVPLNLR